MIIIFFRVFRIFYFLVGRVRESRLGPRLYEHHTFVLVHGSIVKF